MPYSRHILKLLAPFSAIASLFAHGVALLTNEWLFSEELMSNPRFNKSNLTAAPEFLSKFTVSGLWVLCQTEPGNLDGNATGEEILEDLGPKARRLIEHPFFTDKSNMNCSVIDYFSDEDYQPDPNDSTMAIPYAAKRAAYLMLLSGCTILLGSFLCFISRICSRRKILTFISGILFVLSGLFILCAIVVYISTFKAEVGNKLRPKSSFQDATFRYHYGVSLMFAVASLMMSEIAGTFSIFLYIREHQIKWQKHISQGIDSCLDMLQATSLMSQHLEIPQPIASYCKKHGGRGRRYSRGKEISRDPSPIPTKTCRTPSFIGAMQATAGPVNQSSKRFSSTSIPDRPEPPHFSFFSVEHFASENASNPRLSSMDMNKELSREFSPHRQHLYRTVYPSPIIEHHRDFNSSEYLERYSCKDNSRDTLRRTTPV